jgi:hypothetical protein
VKVQRVDASTEFLVSVSSSSSSSSSPSVDGVGVEAKADGLEVLEDRDMHLLGRVVGSGESVLRVFWYVGVRWQARVAWVVFRSLQDGEFMMAKLVANAIGGTRSCESRKPGSTAGKIRVPADLCGLRSLAKRELASFCSQAGNMSSVILREIGALLG